MKHYIYLYRDPITLIPFYVGQGIDDRFLFHLKASQKPRIGSQESLCIIECRRLQNQNRLPIVEKVLEGLTQEEANLEEIHIIGIYKRKIDGGSLVNQTLGGNGCSGYKQTPVHISKRIAKQIGQIRTEDQRARMRWTRGPMSEAGRSAIRKSNQTEKARKRVSDQFSGKPIPEERKKKISASMIQLGHRPPIVTGSDHPRSKGGQILLPSGEIKTFSCLSSFCKDLGLNISTVRNTLTKGRPLVRGAFAGLKLLSRE